MNEPASSPGIWQVLPLMLSGLALLVSLLSWAATYRLRNKLHTDSQRFDLAKQARGKWDAAAGPLLDFLAEEKHTLSPLTTGSLPPEITARVSRLLDEDQLTVFRKLCKQYEVILETADTQSPEGNFVTIIYSAEGESDVLEVIQKLEAFLLNPPGTGGK